MKTHQHVRNCEKGGQQWVMMQEIKDAIGHSAFHNFHFISSC